MSQDLLAAFGSTDESNKSQQSFLISNQTSSFFDEFSKPTQATSQVGGEDDDWGDFEGTATEEQGIENQMEILTLDQAKNLSATVPETSKSRTWSNEGSGNGPVKQARPEPRDPNVLFDASEDLPSEDEDDDDFGEFEGTQETQVVAKPAPLKSASADLLGLEEDSSASNVRTWSQQKTESQPTSSLLDLEDLLGPTSPPSAPTQSSSARRALEVLASDLGTKPISTTADRPNASTLSFSRPKIEKQTPPSAASKPATEEEEPWEDFTSSDTAAKPTSSTDFSCPPFTIPAASSPPPEPPHAVPPTTIPQPAILLSLFPTLLTSLSSSFFNPLSSQSPEIRHQIYTSPAAITYLKSYLSLAVVCARIIAGRKLRWKRDTVLSQSMRIGQASGGMKVTSIDRAEAQREDREVADVVKAWQGLVGRLRGAVAEVRKAVAGTEKIGMVEGLVVPEMRDVMAVRSVGAKEGGVVGVRACALCGLKREERVYKVDGEVFDGFGEWWVEGMEMHRACRNFWLEHESKLRQR